MDVCAYGSYYNVPIEHQPPDDTELSKNTEYPDQNSRDYAKRPINHLPRMHKAWECVALSKDNNIVIATNKLSGRVWTGSFWGFEQLDDLSPTNAMYKLQCSSLIVGVKFIAENILLSALYSGRLQLWSTRSEMRGGNNPYSLFLIGEKCDHAKPITCLDVSQLMPKAVSCSKDGSLKVWGMGSADLCSEHTFRYAHKDNITGVSFSPNDACVLASCSLDKSALLWDIRLARPAVGIFDDHHARFKSISWAGNSKDNEVFLGDEIGVIYTVDIRCAKTLLKSVAYFDRPIRKILPKGEKLAVIGDTNIVKVSSGDDHKTIYENGDAQHFLRDGAWTSSDKFVVVGFEGKMRLHTVVNS